jgi:hypothetical protein
LKNGLINEDVAEFVAVTAGNVKITVVWDGRKLRQILMDLPVLSLEQEPKETLGMNIANSTKTSKKFYQITRHQIPGGNNLQRMH